MKEQIYSIPHNPDIITVNSLEEYLEHILSSDADEYYRGENTSYALRMAASNRKKDSGELFHEYYNPDQLLSDYYKLVGDSIDKAHNDNFMAFAQHHGLPTPLLDITNNPLVALYFATDNFLEEDGYVYTYAKNREINISKFLRGNKPTNIFDLITDFNVKDDDFVRTLVSGMYNIYFNNPKFFRILFISVIKEIKVVIRDDITKEMCTFIDRQDFYHDFFTLVDTCKRDVFIEDEGELLEEWQSVKQCEYIDQFDLNSSSRIYKDFDNFCNKIETLLLAPYTDTFIPQSLYGIDNTEIILDVLFYIYILVTYLRFIRYEVKSNSIKNLPYLPNFIYEPTFQFERMKAQSGLFFYQTYHYKSKEEGEKESIITQNYLPSKIFIIKNKKEISRNLDKININRSTLFPDFDNIAAFLKAKDI